MQTVVGKVMSCPAFDMTGPSPWHCSSPLRCLEVYLCGCSCDTIEKFWVILPAVCNVCCLQLKFFFMLLQCVEFSYAVCSSVVMEDLSRLFEVCWDEVHGFWKPQLHLFLACSID